MSENMKLWDAVCKTNPALTKQVNQRGGFTAVCAQAQVKMATEHFGKYGKGWGLKNCKYEIIGTEIVFDAVFYAGDSEFEITVDMIYKAGQDCRKKLRTDAQSKALSLLGFNSDIFEGKFDDNKYVNELKEEFNKPTVEELAKTKKQQDIASYKNEIGRVLKERMTLGTHLNEVKSSIKKAENLGVEELNDCNDLEKLKAYYLKQQGKLTEQKQPKEEK
ncbi:MAG: hypothetical protein GY928_22185 [Colwellia sp.]|nr:hypothetical protein [Colwellia sp.]